MKIYNCFCPGIVVLLALGCGGGSSTSPSPDSAIGPVVTQLVPDTTIAPDTAITLECITSSATSMRKCVDPTRYLSDLEFVAKPRPPGTPHWQAVQDLCATRFEQMGFVVERHAYATGVNVVGTRVGGGAEPTVLVSAHYDHIDDCPGADDDGTGLAGVLELARIFSTATYAGTLILACWDEEEPGMYGSKAYVARLKTRGTKITAMMGFEMLGYRSSKPNSQTMPASAETFFSQQAAQAKANEMRGDFIALVYDQSAGSLISRLGKQATAEGLRIMEFMVQAGLKRSPLAADLRWSDHSSFWDADIPAIMLTDTGSLRNPNYHCMAGPDAVADLDLDFAVKVVRATAGTLAETLVVR